MAPSIAGETTAPDSSATGRRRAGGATGPPATGRVGWPWCSERLLTKRAAYPKHEAAAVAAAPGNHAPASPCPARLSSAIHGYAVAVHSVRRASAVAALEAAGRSG